MESGACARVYWCWLCSGWGQSELGFRWNFRLLILVEIQVYEHQVDEVDFLLPTRLKAWDGSDFHPLKQPQFAPIFISVRFGSSGAPTDTPNSAHRTLVRAGPLYAARMAEKTLADLAEHMRGIEVAMFTTPTENGKVASRPMRNNGDVTYEGTSYYFTKEDTRTVNDLRASGEVSLIFVGKDEFWLAVEGKGVVIRERSAMEAHWSESMAQWFEEGLETSGLVMIEVKADRAHYWDGHDGGEIALN